MLNLNNGLLSKFKRDLLSVRIQGASAVAHETLRAVAAYTETLVPTQGINWKKLKNVASFLSTLRPTEPMARNISRWFVNELELNWPKVKNKDNWSAHVSKVADEISYQLKEIDAQIAKFGSRLVQSKQTIFTHCHSTLAENILIAARRSGKRFKVYHTETRPLFQGHITDKHLRGAGIPTTMVVDSAAAYLVSDHSGDEVKINMVILGADSIGRDGSVINKIGSFGIALTAYDSKIPVYVASSLLKVDWHNETKIEIRLAREVWPYAPQGTKIVNYAFDRIPAKYITGVITEFGIIKPQAVSVIAKKNYPWIKI